eukprot:COSAG05_NODE_14721_length_389_cov_0.893103_1_plen_58_part_10
MIHSALVSTYAPVGTTGGKGAGRGGPGGHGAGHGTGPSSCHRILALFVVVSSVTFKCP